MEFAITEVLDVLNYLLPGLVASWAFHLVTPHDKPENLSALIEALLFTALVLPMVLLIQHASYWICDLTLICVGEWTKNSSLVSSISLGFLLGIAAGWISNNDWLHSALRKLNVTKGTSYPSEWYGHFFREDRFLILDLRDGRRIQGWPAEWPNSPAKGHFALMRAQWLLDNGSDPIPLDNAQVSLVPATEVVYVQLLKWKEEISREQEAPATAAPKPQAAT